MTTNRRKPVTVGELRDWLSTLPQDSPVMIPGYEGGFNFPPLTSHELWVCYDPSWYCGEYDHANEFTESNEEPFMVTVLCR